MLIEVHMLKNYPPTNLNRDDTGAPKTCIFGGIQRSRISSQCLKRSWRQSEVFSEEVGKTMLGIRTRKLPELVGKKLIEHGMESSFADAIMQMVSGMLKNDKNKKNKSSDTNKKEAEDKENPKSNITQQIAFYSDADIEAVASAVMKIAKDYKDVKAINKDKALKEAISKEVANGAKLRPITLDIALFGRMITSDMFEDVDAAMQVAHAISTNRLTMESDYYAAMDDLITGKDSNNIGAAMLGDIDYNSSCYYIYASIDTEKLKDNLRNVPEGETLVENAIPAIIKAMAFTNPSGKQNSFAGHVLPSAVLVECKEKKIPLSYVNAFVEPAKADRNEDLVKNSINRLVNEVEIMNRDYNLPAKKRLWFCSSKYDVHINSDVQSCRSFTDLINQLVENIH